MNLKKILLSSFMAGGLALSASAVDFDYGLGLGIGLKTSGFHQKNVIDPTKELYDSLKVDEKSFTNFSWNTGGFLGAGVVFGDSLSHGVGLEWTGMYEASSLIIGTKVASVKVKEGRTEHNFTQFADVYYRLGFNMVKGLPMALQFNLGMAHRFVLSQTIYNGTATGEIEYNNDDRSISGFGIHAGARFNVHMFFVGLDYYYLPSLTNAYKDSFTGKSYTETTKTSSKFSNYAGNQVAFTVGVTLNKAIMDSFMGK